MNRTTLAPWLFLAAAVALGLVEARARIALVREGYRLEELRRVRDALREESRLLRLALAGEQRAAEGVTRDGTRAVVGARPGGA